MQKTDFCISVCKTNFTDHYTPDTVHGLVETRFWSVNARLLLYNTQKYQGLPFLPIKRCQPLQWLDYMKTNHFKNLFSTTYTY